MKNIANFVLRHEETILFITMLLGLGVVVGSIILITQIDALVSSQSCVP